MLSESSGRSNEQRRLSGGFTRVCCLDQSYHPFMIIGIQEREKRYLSKCLVPFQDMLNSQGERIRQDEAQKGMDAFELVRCLTKRPSKRLVTHTVDGFPDRNKHHASPIALRVASMPQVGSHQRPWRVLMGTRFPPCSARFHPHTVAVSDGDGPGGDCGTLPSLSVVAWRLEEGGGGIRRVRPVHDPHCPPPHPGNRKHAGGDFSKGATAQRHVAGTGRRRHELRRGVDPGRPSEGPPGGKSGHHRGLPARRCIVVAHRIGHRHGPGGAPRAQAASSKLLPPRPNQVRPLPAAPKKPSECFTFARPPVGALPLRARVRSCHRVPAGEQDRHPRRCCARRLARLGRRRVPGADPHPRSRQRYLVRGRTP